MKFIFDNIIPTAPGVVMDMLSNATETVAQKAFRIYQEILKQNHYSEKRDFSHSLGKRLCENMDGSRNGRIFFSEGPSHQKARARRRSFKRCEQKWTSHLLGEMQFTILSSQTGTAHFKPRLWSRAALPFRSDPTSKVPRRACPHPRLRQVPDH